MEEKNEQQNKSQLKTVRTFSSDMAEAVRENEVSVIKIAMAEKEKREQDELFKKVEGTKTSKTIFFVAGILLIGLAVFGFYYLQNKKQKEEEKLVEKNKQKIETFINYDNAIFVDVTETTNVINLASLLRTKINEEKVGINSLFLTKESDKEISQLIDKDTFVSILKTTAPNSLIRSLSNVFLLGKEKPGENKDSSLFLIFGVNDYNLAYASMLDWERTMFRDLFILFDIVVSDSSNALFEKDWKDLIVNNKDARVLYGDNGEGVLFYSFVNKNTLVITKELGVMKNIISAILVKNP